MDLVTYAVLNKKIDAVGNVPDEKIAEAVNTYLNENPVAPGATAEQAAQINKNVADIDGLKSDLEELDYVKIDSVFSKNTSESVKLKPIEHESWMVNDGIISIQLNKLERGRLLIEMKQNYSSLTIADGFQCAHYANNTGINTEAELISSWKSGTIFLKNYKYYYIILRKSDNSNISNGELDNAIVLNISKEKKYSCVTPEMFGAVGNGSEDDTTALQEAFYYANLNKTPLLLSGIYKVSETITVKQCFAFGTGNSRIVNQTDKYTFKIIHSGAKLFNFSVEANYGIMVGDWNTRVLSVLCQNILITNCFVGFYHPTSGGYNRFVNCSVSDMKDYGKAFIIGANDEDIGESRDVGTNYVYLDGCAFSTEKRWESTSTYGIYVNSCQFLFVNNCDIVGMYRGLTIPQNRNGLVSDLYFSNTTFFSCVRCLNIAGSESYLLYNVSFTNCSFGLTIGYIESNVDSRIVDIGFYGCHYINTGEKEELGISKAELYINLVQKIYSLDISGVEHGNYKESVTGYTKDRIIQKQNNRITVSLNGNSESIVYGHYGTLIPVPKPVIIARSGNLPNYTMNENQDGTWVINFESGNCEIEII